MKVSPSTDEVCAMCGMEIHHPDQAVNMEVSCGHRVYFCCIWCMRIYQRETLRILLDGMREARDHREASLEGGDLDTS